MRPLRASSVTLLASRRRPSAARRLAVVAAVACLAALAGCGVEPVDPVQAAQANVASKQSALATAEADSTAAATAFCDAGADYLTALDRYGDVLVDTAPTVGDVKNAGKDLREPREDTVAAANAVQAAREQVVVAEAELADAQAALAEAEARASGQTPTPSKSSATPSPTPSVAPPSVARVQQAERDLSAAEAGISDQTPLREAAEEFNAAVVALEMAWLQLFADAGCLTDDQQEQAVAAVRDYTLALQEALAEVGRYEGEVDGVYGPLTVAGVTSLQEAHDLPQTGVMDRATEAALRAELVAKGGAEAVDAIASTAVLQQTLKLAGYWDGEVDGIWSDELTEALKDFQEDLGVPATGKVDSATIAAFQEALEKAGEATPEPSAAPSEAPSSEAPSAEPTEASEPTTTPTP